MRGFVFQGIIRPLRLPERRGWETVKFTFWLIIAIIFFILWIRYVERHNIYFPMKEVHVTPETVGLAYEEIYFTTSDNKKIHGWFIPGNTESLTILFCHGNGGNIGHRLEKLAFFQKLGLNTFIFDYRGYGKSEGAPSEKGLYKDADAAYSYLTVERGVPKERIVIYGESLGGPVAIDLAKNESVKALITEEAVASIRDMAKIVYPFIPPFVISSKFDSVAKIKNVNCPKLIIHSVDDEIVPFYLGEKLFNAARPQKKFLKIRGSHNTAFFDSEKEVTEGVKSFLNL